MERSTLGILKLKTRKSRGIHGEQISYKNKEHLATEFSITHTLETKKKYINIFSSTKHHAGTYINTVHIIVVA